MTDQATTYTITVEAMPDPLAARLGSSYERSAEYRLKLWLKWGLRSMGLKCVRISTTPDQASADVRPGS